MAASKPTFRRVIAKSEVVPPVDVASRTFVLVVFVGKRDPALEALGIPLELSDESVVVGPVILSGFDSLATIVGLHDNRIEISFLAA
jgi:hypothetical protein